MRTNPILRKELVCGIIILFLGMSIIPIVGSLLIEKYPSINDSKRTYNNEKKTGQRGLNITFNGTKGENGWYVSPIEIIIVFEPDEFQKHFYYKIDFGNSTEYTPPVDDVFVNEDGSHSFYGYFTDDEGNIVGIIGPFGFKIDQTSPDIFMTVTRLNLLGTKWSLNANTSDATSGITKVDFYVNDVLVGNATASPYEFTYHGTGTVVQAVAYDNAGNWALTPSITILLISLQSQIQNNFNVQQKIVLFHNILYNFLLHHQMNRWNQ